MPSTTPIVPSRTTGGSTSGNGPVPARRADDDPGTAGPETGGDASGASSRGSRTAASRVTSRRAWIVSTPGSRRRVQVPTRPDWYFVKLHTHGAPEGNQRVLLGEPMVRVPSVLARTAGEDPSFQFHYVTAREMYNLVRAAEAGWQGTVAAARDYELVFNGAGVPTLPSSPVVAGAAGSNGHTPRSSEVGRRGLDCASRTWTGVAAMINTATIESSSAAASRATGNCRRLLALALAFAWSWPFDVRAADYWVAPGGRDAAARGNRTRPWATLQYAANRVQPGDTVHVRDGDYGGFYLSRGGMQGAPVRFRAEGEHVRITERNAKTPDGINVEGADFVVIEGFVINEMPRAGIRATHSAGSTIRHIRADNNRSWGIFTSFCEDILIEGNTVTRSIREHGIYVSNSGDRPVIRGNVSRDNRGCGIHMNGDASQGGDGIISGALVENNVISGNGQGGGSGINCDGVQDSRIQNNLLYENHSNGISLYRVDAAAGSSGNSVINNTVVQASGARWAVNIKNQSTNNVVVNNILFHYGSRGGINIAADSLSGFRSDYNIVVDRFSPDDGDHFIRLAEWRSATGLDRHSQVSRLQDVFVNLESSDYHLRAGSPAIDAADPALAPRMDIEGSPRPKGRPDAGAYEAKDGKTSSNR